MAAPSHWLPAAKVVSVGNQEVTPVPDEAALSQKSSESLSSSQSLSSSEVYNLLLQGQSDSDTPNYCSLLPEHSDPEAGGQLDPVLEYHPETSRPGTETDHDG